MKNNKIAHTTGYGHNFFEKLNVKPVYEGMETSKTIFKIYSVIQKEEVKESVCLSTEDISRMRSHSQASMFYYMLKNSLEVKENIINQIEKKINQNIDVVKNRKELMFRITEFNELCNLEVALKEHISSLKNFPVLKMEVTFNIN